ncbi:MAG: hypothetical protein V4682_03260 [Patescibacteria group bacterium]
MGKFLNLPRGFTLTGFVLGLVIVLSHMTTDPGWASYFPVVVIAGTYFVGCVLFGLYWIARVSARDIYSARDAERNMMHGALVVLAAACLLASESIFLSIVLGVPLLTVIVVWYDRSKLACDYLEHQSFGFIVPPFALGFAVVTATMNDTSFGFIERILTICLAPAFGYFITWAFCLDDDMLRSMKAEQDASVEADSQGVDLRV